MDLDKYSEIYSEHALKRFRDKINIPEVENDCWEWISGVDKNGYGNFWANGKNVRAHRFAYQIFKGKIPKSLLVCHSCDNPGCVNPAHLKLGTNQDNMNDMVLRNRQAKGKDIGLSILSEEQVRDILTRINNSQFKSTVEVASAYKIDSTCINKILDGTSWKHITNQLTISLSEIKAKIVRSSQYGSNNHNAKLTKEKVLDILTRINNKKFNSIIEVASEYNVSASCIYDILNGKG